MDADGISVVLCCYNSVFRLPATLRHLAAQQVHNEIPWEVIVVDNASGDQTAEVAQSEWEKYDMAGVGFQVIYEEKPGLSHARNRGINTTRFRYIIFCDDDNWLDSTYVQTVYNALSANPSIAALGGQSTAVADISLPGWFSAAKNNYAVGQQAMHSGDVSYRKHLWGSGLAIRKHLYKKTFDGFPSLLTGRNGEALSSGEDSEMCLRFLLMGYRLYYLEELTFQHYIAAERLSKDYNKKLEEGFVNAYRTLNAYARLIEVRKRTLTEKLKMLTMPLLRILTAGITGLKRWNITDEKLQVFLITGYPFRSVHSGLRAIRQIVNER